MCKINVFWFRRDLRSTDNCGLYHALKADLPVLPLFIFDTNILSRLRNTSDARVTFIHDALKNLNREFKNFSSYLLVKQGSPEEVFADLVKTFEIQSVFTNRDYEPYAKNRDLQVKNYLENNEIKFHSFKDHVLLESEEVLKEDGKPYTVFTPYSRKWIEKFDPNISYPSEDLLNNLYKGQEVEMLSLEELGFSRSDKQIPSPSVSVSTIRNYDKNRDFPGLEGGTSKLGIHFRFGTISIREKAAKALKLNRTFLNELIWRDFYATILDQFPYVVGHAFKPQYDQIEWLNDETAFEKWCTGMTGYPLVDAGMRELNATGYMHNRVRMVTASFLTKHLLIDWRWGEQYFAAQLLDFDLASNNGGWQWAAGSGTDAAPYFRIFNPTAQQEKFDPECVYVKRWIPELGTSKYPKPIVDHKFARERCLNVYKAGLQLQSAS